MRAYLHYRDGRVVSMDVDAFMPTLSRALFRVQGILWNITTTEFQIDAHASREAGGGIYREI